MVIRGPTFVTTPLDKLIFAKRYVRVTFWVMANAVPSVAVGSTASVNTLAPGAVTNSKNTPPWIVSTTYRPVPPRFAPSR